MKPTNERPDLLLEDGAPCTCHFMARADAPLFMERCETNATEFFPGLEDEFKLWLERFPKAIIMLYPGYQGNVYLCDAHKRIMTEIGVL